MAVRRFNLIALILMGVALTKKGSDHQGLFNADMLESPSLEINQGTVRALAQPHIVQSPRHLLH